MDSSKREALEQTFPRLRASKYAITSAHDVSYNCIAWAAGDSARWWEPDVFHLSYWPPAAPRELNLDAYEAAFGTLGFAQCDDGSLEEGFEKVALYAHKDGRPTHAARQLRTGTWTSKLGTLEDIEHELQGLQSKGYGSVARFLKRPL